MTKNLVSKVASVYQSQLFDFVLAQNLLANLRSDLPFLFIWGTKDATAVPFVITKSKIFIPRYQDIALEGRGHWLMVEAKDEITDNIMKWLEGLTSQHLERL